MLQSNVFIPFPHIRFAALALLLGILLFSSCKESYDPAPEEIWGNYSGRYVKIHTELRTVGYIDTFGNLNYTQRIVHDTSITEAFTVGVSKIAPDSLEAAVDIPVPLLGDLRFLYRHEPSGRYEFSKSASYPLGYGSENVDIQIDANTKRLWLKLISQGYGVNQVSHTFEGVRQ